MVWQLANKTGLGHAIVQSRGNCCMLALRNTGVINLHHHRPFDSINLRQAARKQNFTGLG